MSGSVPVYISNGPDAGNQTVATATDSLTIGANTYALAGSNPQGIPQYTWVAQASVTDLEALETALGDAMPANHDVFLTAGVIGGSSIECKSGKGILRIIGNKPAAVPTTGDASGAAGSGTTTTSIVKPTGADDWTADDTGLIGKFVYVPSLAQANQPCLRPIRAVSTTALTIDVLAGMAAGVAFQLVDLDSSFSELNASDLVGVRLRDNVAAIEFHGIEFNNASTLDKVVELVGNKSVLFNGCRFTGNATIATLYAKRNEYVAINYCTQEDGADIQLIQCDAYSVVGLFNNGGGQFLAQDCGPSDGVQINAVSSTDTVANFTRSGYCPLEVKADSCSSGASVIYAEDSHIEAVGTNKLTGTNASATRAVELVGSTVAMLAGSDMTSGAAASAHVLAFTRATTWATLGSYAIVSGMGRAQATGNPSKLVYPIPPVFEAQSEFSAATLFDGLIYHAKEEGLTAAGTDAGTALQLNQAEVHVVSTAASGTGVIAYSGPQLTGVFDLVINHGANDIKYYPTSGGTVDGGASATIVAGGKGLFVSDGGSGKNKTRLI